MSSRWIRRLEAFTLLELLVVVTVLVVLAALILRSLDEAREVARRTACRSNKKQFSVALEAVLPLNVIRSSHIKSAIESKLEAAWPTLYKCFVRRQCKIHDSESVEGLVSDLETP